MEWIFQNFPLILGNKSVPENHEAQMLTIWHESSMMTSLTTDFLLLGR